MVRSAYRVYQKTRKLRIGREDLDQVSWIVLAELVGTWNPDAAPLRPYVMTWFEQHLHRYVLAEQGWTRNWDKKKRTISYRLKVLQVPDADFEILIDNGRYGVSEAYFVAEYEAAERCRLDEILGLVAEREQDLIYDLVLAGRSSAEVAKERGLSPYGLGRQLSRVLERLQAALGGTPNPYEELLAQARERGTPQQIRAVELKYAGFTDLEASKAMGVSRSRVGQLVQEARKPPRTPRIKKVREPKPRKVREPSPWAIQAMQLRAQGLSWRAVADAVGMARNTVWKACRRMEEKVV
jgi:RNA polymerase sigma factor (sigma-70 family)